MRGEIDDAKTIVAIYPLPGAKTIKNRVFLALLLFFFLLPLPSLLSTSFGKNFLCDIASKKLGARVRSGLFVSELDRSADHRCAQGTTALNLSCAPRSSTSQAPS